MKETKELTKDPQIISSTVAEPTATTASNSDRPNYTTVAERFVAATNPAIISTTSVNGILRKWEIQAKVVYWEGFTEAVECLFENRVNDAEVKNLLDVRWHNPFEMPSYHGGTHSRVQNAHVRLIEQNFIETTFKPSFKLFTDHQVASGHNQCKCDIMLGFTADAALGENALFEQKYIVEVKQPKQIAESKNG
jgi:hypothetical protein